MRHQRPRHDSSPVGWVAAFTLLIVAGAAPSPRATAPAPSSGTVSPVLSSDAPLEQYRAMRRMHALAEKANHEGWVDAMTEYDASGFRYQIVAERGSDTVRNRVLKALLKREQELIEKGDAGRGDLTSENYEFGPETTAEGLRYVPITPKRKDVMLIDGRMVLNGDGDLVRVEGRLAKNPSFWTTQVDVVRQYARVDGVRVPVATESIAKVRFAGPSKLNVKYEYETINNRVVKTTAATAPAGISPASAR